MFFLVGRMSLEDEQVKPKHVAIDVILMLF
jgi:hypothetical protein